MEDVDQELVQFIDNVDKKQLVTLIEELRDKEYRRLIDYITSLLSV